MSTQTSLSPADTELAFRRLLDAYRGSFSAATLSVLEPILLSAAPVTVAELRQKLPLSRTHLGTTLVRLADRQLILHVTRGVYVRNPEALLHVMPRPSKPLRRRITSEGVALKILEELLRSRKPASRTHLRTTLQVGPVLFDRALAYLFDHQMIEKVQRSYVMLAYLPPDPHFQLDLHKPKDWKSSL